MEVMEINGNFFITDDKHRTCQIWKEPEGYYKCSCKKFSQTFYNEGFVCEHVKYIILRRKEAEEMLKDKIPCFQQVITAAVHHVKAKRFDQESLSGWLMNKIPGAVTAEELREVEELAEMLLNAQTDRELERIRISY